MDDEVKRIKEMLAAKQKRYWAKSGHSVARKLELEFPPGFVTDALNAYLQKGIVPDDPRILDLGQRIKYWHKLQAEAEAKKEARTSRKRGHLSPYQRARLNR